MNLLSGNKEYNPHSDAYVTAYISFFKKREGREDNANESRDLLPIRAKAHLVDELYKHLDTLDSKANALLSFCGLVLTSLALLLSFSVTLSLYKPILIVLFCSVALAALLALTVVQVHWSNPHELRERSLDEACRSYHATREQRTARYLFAWWVLFASVVILGGYMAIDALVK